MHPKKTQKILNGEKPPEDVLNATLRKLNEYQFKIMTKDEPLPDYIDGMANIPMKNISQAISMKLKFACLVVFEKIEGKKMTSTTAKQELEKWEPLVLFWFAKKGIPPIPDYYETLPPSIRNSDEDILIPTMEELQMGYKPPSHLIRLVEGFWNMTTLFGGGGISRMFVGGAGELTPNTSKPEKILKMIGSGAFKIAKDGFNLEDVQSDTERSQLLNQCAGLIIYWIMKHWINIPL